MYNEVVVHGAVDNILVYGEKVLVKAIKLINGEMSESAEDCKWGKWRNK